MSIHAHLIIVLCIVKIDFELESELKSVDLGALDYIIDACTRYDTVD